LIEPREPAHALGGEFAGHVALGVGVEWLESGLDVSVTEALAPQLRRDGHGRETTLSVARPSDPCRQASVIEEADLHVPLDQRIGDFWGDMFGDESGSQIGGRSRRPVKNAQRQETSTLGRIRRGWNLPSV